MANYSRELEKIEVTINEKKIEKARLEERKASLEKEKKDIDAKIAEYIPDGMSADEWLAKEEAEIKKGLEECSKILQGR